MGRARLTGKVGESSPSPGRVWMRLRLPAMPSSQLRKTPGQRERGQKFWYVGFISRADAEFVDRMV